ncbi:hypothetical protein Kpol_2001p30 [Vanderwaltozyma polyspora DSM 70294]|uniref:Probable serine/threonine-protein kinase HAL5-like n=1 Tax=Vanderwaltozyma polyspora (strain ATCC 22028 / DSM 70294 / BCRC 21397 / CBS 2163 / NBRC 10782 / NRRL Y-8283 / UCD 57-17) TaxID=436907 RepID=HAL5_VANPO|nr:uncharacterized protein Kpol_2001p30 [Vanderwaltozyma polyspora DSM 70294]A7TGR2.1 RecName: Full=Probable serine/threonine-protein kinase HAL5-like [Vanderwaltozyma polyspora DSM 70294]EDO18525.1 hypothetical protein Kpol_2001p30 [Vanderwaltozyma polyspora DSM 70294]
MGTVEQKSTHTSPPTSPISRARSISGSIKSLFKPSSVQNSTPTVSPHESSPPLGNSDNLKKLVDTKRAELSSSRGAPPVNVNNVSNLSINTDVRPADDQPQVKSAKSPIIQTPKMAMNIVPQNIKSVLSSPRQSSSTNDRSSITSATSSVTSANDQKEKNYGSGNGSADDIPIAQLRLSEQDRAQDYTIDNALDTKDKSKPVKRNNSTSAFRGRKDKNFESSEYEIRSNSLSRIHSTPQNESPTVNNIHRGRPYSESISISSLKHIEQESKCILQVDNFKVFENGMHVHNLKIMPIVKSAQADAANDHDSNELNKQKSMFSLTSIFKSHKEDSGVDNSPLENLDNAVSLLPSIKNMAVYNRKRNISSSTAGTGGSDSDSIPDDLSERMVNPCAAIGAEELKLINTLSERINDAILCKSGKKSSHMLKEKDPDAMTFTQLYGKSMGVVLGHGAYGVVRLFSRNATERDPQYLQTYCNGQKMFFAVKELKPKSSEPKEKFSTRITSEFIIGHSLNHSEKKGGSKYSPNIIRVLDLLEISSGSFIEVLEFCPSGDLYNILTRKTKNGTALHPLEADCFMKQLLTGVQYMHSHGVAHCDLKPENILFHPNGLLKICDFGTSCVFQTAWEKNVHFQTGAVGSEPYVAPEEFIHDFNYDPRLVDCWSCGVVYCSMVLGHYLWKLAVKEKDPLYKAFYEEISSNKEFYVFEEMRHVNHEINRLRKISLYKIFQPNPDKRITIDQLLQSPWMKNTRCCIDYKTISS